VQECPDREFALVAKRTLTYIKYLVFPRAHLALVVAGTLEGMRDGHQWHARAAALKFCQAFAYRHSFTLSTHEMASLRDETFAALCDVQIEVRTMARDTLDRFPQRGIRGDCEFHSCAVFERVQGVAAAEAIACGTRG